METDIATPKDNFTWADILKFLAIVGVILMHAGSVLFSKSITEQKMDWLTGMFYNSLGIFSVPIFLMLSGAFLLQFKDDLKTYFWKRIKKVLMPFFFWVIIYAFFIKYYFKINISIPIWVSTEFITGPVFYHMWYIFLILGLYLVIPILRTWVNNASKNEIYYFLLLWIITVSVLPLITVLFNFKPAIHLNFIHQYIGYLILGYYLKDKEISSKYALVYFLFFCLSICISTIATYKLSIHNGSTSVFFIEKMSITTLITSTTLFLIVKHISTSRILNSHKIKSIIKQLGDLSFGIYLVHAIILICIMDGAFGFKITVDQINPILGVPIVAFVTYLLSASVILILKKTKVLTFIVP